MLTTEKCVCHLVSAFLTLVIIIISRNVTASSSKYKKMIFNLFLNGLVLFGEEEKTVDSREYYCTLWAQCRGGGGGLSWRVFFFWCWSVPWRLSFLTKIRERQVFLECVFFCLKIRLNILAMVYYGAYLLLRFSLCVCQCHHSPSGRWGV